jgi:hypothetical protein
MPLVFLSGTLTQPEFGRQRKLSHRLGPVDEQADSISADQIRVANTAATRFITPTVPITGKAITILTSGAFQ